MERKRFICIICPKGCEIDVITEGSRVVSVENYGCPRGKDYAVTEATDPKRLVFTTIRVNNGEVKMLSVKTEKPIPKRLIRDVMKELSTVVVDAPVEIGDVIVKNILNTGVDVIATRCVEVRK